MFEVLVEHILLHENLDAVAHEHWNEKRIYGPLH